MYKTSKKLLTYVICSLFITMLVANVALADAKKDASDALQHAVDGISQTLNNSNLKNLSEDSAVVSELEKKILDIFSMEQFSMRTVGKKWKSFSPSQKTAFKDAFVKLLKATYFKHISEYDGQTLTIVGARTNKKGSKVEVRTVVNIEEKEIPISYRMLVESKKWMVYDVLVEGVSMVKNYRTQFKELLRKGSPDDLIRKLQEKAVRVRQKQAAADKQ